ncbi:MAG: NAD(P)H-binding protein [Cyanobacteria bacterium P01_G01_bin.19]
MSKSTILVTNATGKTGFATVEQLLEAEYYVRAFVRRRNHRAINLERLGAELFIGDLSNTADLNLAMQGVQRAYLCIPPTPNILFTSVAILLR